MGSKILVICWLILLGGVLRTESVIHLFRHCDEEVLVENDVNQILEISGSEWQASFYTCLVTFRSSGIFDLVYYEFDTFNVNSDDIEVTLDSSTEKMEGFKNQGVYGTLTSPAMSSTRTAARYLRVSVSRAHLNSFDISVSLRIYAKAGAHGTGLKTGQVVGIVIGCVVCILVLITLIVCCAIGAKYPDRRGSIYTVARRLSIFATPAGQDQDADQDSDIGEDAKKPGKEGGTGHLNEGYLSDRAAAEHDESYRLGYISRTGQPSSEADVDKS